MRPLPEADPKTILDIWVLPMDGADHKPIPFLRSEFNELLGQLSPDNHWMAYTLQLNLVLNWDAGLKVIGGIERSLVQNFFLRYSAKCGGVR